MRGFCGCIRGDDATVLAHVHGWLQEGPSGQPGSWRGGFGIAGDGVEQIVPSRLTLELADGRAGAVDITRAATATGRGGYQFEGVGSLSR